MGFHFPKGNIPWNKGKPHPAARGNKFNFRGDRAKPDAGRKRAQAAFPTVEPCARCGVLDFRPRRMVRHHKDENTLNNAPGNVEFLCRACHIREHAVELRTAHVKKYGGLFGRHILRLGREHIDGTWRRT